MESNDMKSSCLKNNVKELRQLQDQESLMKKAYESALKSLKTFFEDLHISIVESFYYESFEFLFGQRFHSHPYLTGSSPGKDTDAEGAKISKNGLDYDITIAKSSHDKDKTAVQWSNNEFFQNDFYHNHEVVKRNEDNKVLKEANDMLTKELKMYKERLQIFGNKPVNNTVLKKDYDELQTQFLIEKIKLKILKKKNMS
ncbi:hypothetical protein Tco_0615387 [Tanacetum coccineum]